MDINSEIKQLCEDVGMVPIDIAREDIKSFLTLIEINLLQIRYLRGKDEDESTIQDRKNRLKSLIDSF